MHTHIFTKKRVLIEVFKNNEKEEFEGCLYDNNIVVNNPKKLLKYLEINIKEDSDKNKYNISKLGNNISLNMVKCKVFNSNIVIDSLYFNDLKIFLENIENNSLYKIEINYYLGPIMNNNYYASCSIYMGILYKESEFLNKNVQSFGNIKVTLEDLKKIGWIKMHCGYIDKINKNISAPSYSELNVSIIEKPGEPKANYIVQEDLKFKFNPDPEISRVYRNLFQQDIDNLNKVIKLANIDNNEKLYLFLSQINAETNNFNGLVEAGGNNKTKSTRNSIKEYFNNNTKYKYKYRGAGTIQLTHWYNYEDFKNYIKDNNIYIEGCEYVAFTYPWLVAGFFWKKNDISKKLNNKKTEKERVKELTYIINGKGASQEEINRRYNEFNKIKNILK
ncbi:hypothetical protein [uncultured Tyzzerella sp.]|uniref:hypothetical protein n=1 Tax=uncultured Tyzzerella sp. TaxID=2321398 RepID=UPI0029420345|nr:hypothetical protein [uncultured Tyzzerella sp.]